MNGLVAIILVSIAVPGAAIGFSIALLRRSSIRGVLADILLGAAGGMAGGAAAMQLLSTAISGNAPKGAWMIWIASAVGAVLAIAIVRSIGRALSGEDAETTV